MSLEAEGPQLHSFQPTVENITNNPIEQQEEGNTTIPENQDEDVTSELKDQTIDEANDVPVLDQEKQEEEEEGEEDEGEEESSGTSVLPLSKIKKIFKTDPEHVTASESAVFTTAIATELFIQYFTEQASLIARSEKRKKLQYKDFSSAVSSIEQLHFLSDTIPKTYNLKTLVEQNQVKYAKDKVLDKGQTTLSFGGNKKRGTSQIQEEDEELPESSDDDDIGEAYKQNGDGNNNEDNFDNINNDDNTDDEQEEDNIRKDRDRDVIMQDSL